MSLQSVPLSEICEIIMGQAPVGSSYNESGEGLALIAGAGDFGQITPAPKKFTTEASKVSKVNDLILCIRATIGDLNWSDKEYCLGRGVAGLRPKVRVLDKNYLWRFIEANKHQLSAKGTGSTFKQVSRSHIAEWEIPLPSLTEQKRIAAILDKADAIRRKRQQVIQLADELLRAVFLDMFGDPAANPKGWDKCKFEDLTDLVTYGLTVRPQYHEEGIPLISAREIRNGELDLKVCPKISKEDFYKLSEKGRPKKEDILFSKTGSIGHCAIVRTELDFAITQNAARIVVKRNLCNPVFLLAYMRTKYFYDLANKEAKGNAVKDLQLGIMKAFPMYLPPISLQDKFVELFTKASVFAEKVCGGSILLNSNFKALSQRAFLGNL